MKALPSFLFLLAAFCPCCVAQTDSLPAASPEKVWQVMEEMPTYRGGRPAWEQYLRQHLRYPEAAKRAGVQGNVYVGFTVCEDGSIFNPKIVRGIHYDCDQEALRLVAEMSNWVPGRQKGVPVPVHYVLPINFSLKP
jgi:protein TonB